MAKSRRRKRTRRRKKNTGAMVFDRWNYVLLSLCVGAIFLGFVLMRIENQLEGIISLYVAPLLLMAGYAGVIYAIMWQSPDTQVESEETP